jgi:hypothetical protein
MDRIKRWLGLNMRYHNLKILLASQHQKEVAIAPPFEKILNANMFVVDFDTDKFGTFTGEVPRLNAPLETCILKAKTCAHETNYPYAIASEGSFGPHPHIPFLPFSHEIMVFVDLEKGWGIHETMSTKNTNYANMEIKDGQDIDSFLKKVQFPKHKLCLQTQKTMSVIRKGINSKACLLEAMQEGFKLDKTLLVSTDMRAMMNPTRMQNIGILAEKLAHRLAQLCPHCQSPGFGQTGIDGALICAGCLMPSRFHSQEIFSCVECSYIEKKPRSDGRIHIDPQFCNFCNP